jgi:hypothetical protein
MIRNLQKNVSNDYLSNFLEELNDQYDKYLKLPNLDVNSSHYNALKNFLGATNQVISIQTPGKYRSIMKILTEMTTNSKHYEYYEKIYQETGEEHF